MSPADAPPDAGDRVEEWWAVYFEGKASAAYPRKMQAEVYASGFSRPAEIRLLHARRAAPTDTGARNE